MKREVLSTEMDNVIDLSKVKANRAALIGGPGGDENWLYALVPGTIFVCKKRNAPKDMLALDLFLITEHKGLVSNLIQKIPTGQSADMWVNNLEFSRFYKYETTIATAELEYNNDKSETTDGNSSGSVQSSGLQNDAPVAG